MNKVEISTKIEYTDYIKLQYMIFYRRPAIIILNIVGLIMLLSIINSLFNGSINESYMTTLIFPFVIFLFLPFSVWLGSKRSFNSNKFLQEVITYTFEENTFRVDGESFNSSVAIDKMYRIKETKRWILLYPSKNAFHIIFKDSISNEKLDSIRAILNLKPGS